MIVDPEIDWRMQVYGGLGGATRKLPPRSVREEILERQGNSCIYCEGEFDQYSEYKGNPVMLNVEWDHFVPYSYTFSNNKDNFVASCQVCNKLKSDSVYKTLNEAREDILPRRWPATRSKSKIDNRKENSSDFQSREHSAMDHIMTSGGTVCNCCQLKLHEYFFPAGSTRRTCIACQRDCRGVKRCNLGRLWGCESCVDSTSPHPTTGHGGKQRMIG